MKIKQELFDELCAAVQESGTLNVIHTNAIAHRIGLSATEFEAMDIITRNQPITAGKLSECCGLTTGAITGIIDRLERGKFVRRERGSVDRRCVFIVPIEDAKRSEKVRELYQPMDRGFRAFVDEYSPEEIRFLTDMQIRANEMTKQSIRELHDSSAA